MKVGIITQPNRKGQIVIPKKFRDTLGINDTVHLNITIYGNGIYIHPLPTVVLQAKRKQTYSHILKKTQGSWKDEDCGTLEKRRHKIERAASLKRRKAW